jgi:triosephosphate isomerase
LIVGHSGRRGLYGETDALVPRNLPRSVGRNDPDPASAKRAERRRLPGAERRQLGAVLSGAGARAFARAVLAYEPVWAIGTGRNATPEQARDVHAFLRARLAQEDAGVAQEMRILYGGSVKAANAPALFAMPELDGGLIGGASLVAQEFLAIARAARKEN